MDPPLFFLSLSQLACQSQREVNQVIMIITHSCIELTQFRLEFPVTDKTSHIIVPSLSYLIFSSDEGQENELSIHFLQQPLDRASEQPLLS
jgi:hypothetical protein